MCKLLLHFHVQTGLFDVLVLFFENELAGSLGALDHVLLLGVVGVHVHVETEKINFEYFQTTAGDVF